MAPTKTLSPLEVLKLAFKRKTERNPKYSLRAFARDLNMSPGRLSVILAGKEEPGHRFISRILQSSVLVAEEKALFESAVRDRMGFDEEAIAPHVNLHEYPSQELDSIQVHSILCLLRTTKTTDDHAWIAKRLKLKKEDVDSAIATLLEHGIIIHKRNKYYQKVAGLVYQEKNQNPTRIAKSYQKFLIDSLPNILDMDRDHSIFGTLVVALDKEDIPKVKKLLQTTFKKIKAISDKSKRTEVYNLSVVKQKMSQEA
ncbi:DUF4423 domain-containing protein [Bdellovibrio bacteriovorus]|uniref:DUF4423 domain-containing protein n=1 Tax=Bdellovibrio bacteriovorus TaxID=959 RepID=UPI0035A71E2B